MLENLSQPAPKITAPTGWNPAVEFDGSEGEATTPGFEQGDKPDFDKFLVEAGFDPSEIEIVGEPRTSRWQVASPWPAEPRWLTSYRFRFRKLGAKQDLPLLYSQAKKNIKKATKATNADKALVILWSDLQVGKTASRGNSQDLIERCLTAISTIVTEIKATKPSRVIVADVGDIIENFSNAADMAQIQGNDLSLMQQVDLATTLTWDLLKQVAAIVPEVTYASIGSNHCQFRINKQRVGLATDDWGIHIGRTLARLSKETEAGIRFFEPQPHDESLVVDVFGDNFHRLGIVHGHQANRPEGVVTYWQKQAFGQQPIASATILASGHFHHLRVQECASNERGASRFWVQAATMDNGSDWYRLNAGEDSQPGVVIFELTQGKEFTGSVKKV